jgi:hypothetical protein
MTVGTQKTEVANLVVGSVAVDVIELEWDRLPVPLAQPTARASMCEHALP